MPIQSFLNVIAPTCVLLNEHGAFSTTLKSFYAERTSTGVYVENSKVTGTSRSKHRENR